MLSRNGTPSSFFDHEFFSKMIPKTHPLTQINTHMDFSFVTPEVADCYHPSNGRPSFPPEMLFRVMFLEIWGNLSDVQVCRELQYNVLYRWFCGIGWEDNVPDDTTVVVFRRRLGDMKFKALFERVVEQAKQGGVLRGKWAIIDGTKVIAHVAVRNNLELIREGKRRILRAVKRHDKKAAEQLSELAEPIKDGEYSSHEQVLGAEILSGRELVDKACGIKHKDVAREIKTYSKFLEFDGVASLTDPDARWGYQKKDEPFLGYKVEATCDERGIVTAVEVMPGNESELSQAEGMVKDLDDRGLKPLRMTGDKAYDDSVLRRDLAEVGIRSYVPSRQNLNRLAEQGFTYETKTSVLQCPCGYQAIGASPHKKGGLIYYFSQRDCGGCAMRQECLTGRQKRKVVYVNPLVWANRPRGLKRAMKIRKTIERVFGDCKTWHKMGRARYRGLWRVKVQVYMTVIVVNAKKSVKSIVNKLCETKAKRQGSSLPCTA